MPSRRSHQNSHHGCLSCKARKVKCDETRPVCQRCRKQGRPCEYASFAPTQSWPTPPSTYNPSTAGSTVGSSPNFVTSPQHPVPSVASPGDPNNGMKISNLLNSAPTSPAPPQGLTTTQCQDLKLMHHWTLHTYKTLVDRENMTGIWREVAPNMAVDHAFLMHGLLSVAAFHLAYLNPKDRQFHIDLALHHHAAAITVVQPALGNISNDNCHALFAFTTVAAVAAFAKGLVTKLTQTPMTQAPDPLDEMLELMYLLRGTTAVVQNSYPWIKAGPLQPMLRGGDPDRLIDLPAELAAALDTLIERNYSLALPEETKAACSDAIEKLRRYFRDPEIAQGEKGKLVAWPIMVQKEYMAALSRREPMALAISAYWGVMVQDLRDMWWAESWGRQVVGAVAGLLNESWEPCLRWAKDKVGFMT